MDEILIEQYTHQENIIKSRVSTTQYLEDVIHTHTHRVIKKLCKFGSQSQFNSYRALRMFFLLLGVSIPKLT